MYFKKKKLLNQDLIYLSQLQDFIVSFVCYYYFILSIMFYY